MYISNNNCKTTAVNLNTEKVIYLQNYMFQYTSFLLHSFDTLILTQNVYKILQSTPNSGI